MARKEAPGLYYVGIYEVERRGKRWHATAFGPGTMGDGKAGVFPTLAAAYLALTGEPLRQPRTA